MIDPVEMSRKARALSWLEFGVDTMLKNEWEAIRAENAGIHKEGEAQLIVKKLNLCLYTKCLIGHDRLLTGSPRRHVY